MFSGSDLQYNGIKYDVPQNGRTIYYSFDLSNSIWSDSSRFNGKYEISNQSLFTTALDGWERFLHNIQLQENDTDPNIVFFKTDFIANGDTGATNTSPNGSEILGSEIAIDSSRDELTANAYWVALHEIGHALGLSHPNNNATDSNYNTDITIMSYNVPDGRYAVTPMALDILAIEEMYGTISYNEGNTTYYYAPDVTGFDWYQFNGVKRSHTIVDTGTGIDTFDFSLYTAGDLTIDLRKSMDAEGNWFGDHHSVIGEEYVYIAHNTEIENAIGGSGNDTIIGNDSANKLIGGAGNDTLKGGAGNDTADYTNSTSAVTITINTTSTSVSDGLGGTDTLYNIESVNANSAYTNNLVLGAYVLDYVYDGNPIVLSDSLIADQRVYTNIDNIILNPYARGYFEVNDLGHTFSGYFYPASYAHTTASYRNYQGSLTFDLYNKTVSNGSETDSFNFLPSIVGTDYGDTYSIYGFSLPPTTYSSSYAIYSGAGDDTFDIATPFGGGAGYDYAPIFYGGGDDIITQTGASYKIILPVGIDASDLETNVENIRMTHSDESYVEYRGDFKISIEGYGSITIEDGYIYSVAVETNNHTYHFALSVDLEIFTPVGVSQISFETAYQMFSAPDYQIVVTPSGASSPSAYFSTMFSNAYQGTFENDTFDLSTFTGWANFNAYDGDDTVLGSSANNLIYGGAGDDRLKGAGGNDALHGGSGNDTAIFVHNFDEYSFSQNTGYITVTDTLSTDGIDTVYDFESLQFRNDVIVPVSLLFDNPFAGSSVADTFDGSSVRDIIAGYGGADILSGDAGDDVMYGGSGDDVINGGDDNDLLDGGAGNDTLSGDAGNDTVSYGGATSAVTVNLSTTSAQNTGGAGTDTISSFENIIGSDYNDTLTGNTAANILTGGLGNDTLDGGAGADTLNGGDGNDTYNYTSGDDIISDTGGTDRLVLPTAIDLSEIQFVRYSTAPEDLRIYVTDTAYNSVIVIEGQLESAATHIETINVSVSGIVMDIAMDQFYVTTWGTGGSEVIYGITFGAREDDVYDDVVGANDIIQAGAGSDLVYAGEGNDTVNGNDGNDGLLGEEGDDVLYGDAGNDSIYGDSNGAVAYGGNDWLEGGAGDDWLDGGSGNDTLKGGANTDILLGKDGADTIFGDAGTDYLIGGSGDDTLYGGAGADELYGEAGADTFIWLSGDNDNTVDTITDFSTAGGDILNIAEIIDFDPMSHVITDFVQITTSGSNSIVSIDANGGGNSFVQIATLQGITGLTDEAALVTNGYLIAA